MTDIIPFSCGTADRPCDSEPEDEVRAWAASACKMPSRITAPDQNQPGDIPGVLPTRTPFAWCPVPTDAINRAFGGNDVEGWMCVAVAVFALVGLAIVR